MELKEIRKFMKFTQQDITDLFGIPRRTFQDWELGNRKCPDWCKNLVIEKMLNYKKDDYITLYKIDDISREEEKNAYLGCVYDEAVETFNKLCQSIDDSRPENFIDIKLYRIPIDFDITNKEQLFNALSAKTGYQLSSF